MRKYFLKTLLAVSVALLLMTFACCHKTPPSPTASTISVGFHFHTFIGGNLVDPVDYPNQWFQDTLGRLLNLSAAQFYITNIAIHIKGGVWVSPTQGLVMLKRIDNEVYSVGTMPAPPNKDTAYIDSVKFTVGLGNALNLYPGDYLSSSATDSVLSTAESVMYGSNMPGMASMPAQSGFTYMYVQGYDSTDHLALNYQLGGYGDTVNVALGYGAGFNFVPVLPSGELNLFHIVADYGTLLNVLHQINSSNNSSQFWTNTQTVEPATATQLLNNIKNIFHWECSPPINC